MKNIRLYAALVACNIVFLGLSVPIHAQTIDAHAVNQVQSRNTEGLEVTLSSETSHYGAGEPVRLDVSIKNLTDQPRQMLYPNGVETMLNIIVQKQDGKLVPLTAYGAQAYVAPDFTQTYHPYRGPIRLDGPIQLGTISPLILAHQQLKFKILVSRLYDMTQSGTYVISVKQWVPRLTGKDVAALVSPNLTVRVDNELNTLVPAPTNPYTEGASGNGRTQFSIGQSF